LQNPKLARSARGMGGLRGEPSLRQAHRRPPSG
jgi:hypothetical protein